jgi:hypothetical protein
MQVQSDISRWHVYGLNVWIKGDCDRFLHFALVDRTQGHPRLRIIASVRIPRHRTRRPKPLLFARQRERKKQMLALRYAHRMIAEVRRIESACAATRFQMPALRGLALNRPNRNYHSSYETCYLSLAKLPGDDIWAKYSMLLLSFVSRENTSLPSVR